MNIIKLVDSVIESFFSKRLILDVCYKWKNYCISYVFFLAFLTITPILLSQLDFLLSISKSEIIKDANLQNQKNDINVIIRDVIDQIPTIELKNAELTSNIERKDIYLPGDGKNVFISIILDQLYDKQNITSPITIFKNAIISNFRENKQVFLLKNYFDSTTEKIFDQNEIIKLVLSIKNITLVFSLTLGALLITCAAFIKITFNSILYAIFIYAFFYYKEYQFSKKAIFRLAVIISTPSIILTLFLTLIFGNVLNSFTMRFDIILNLIQAMVTIFYIQRAVFFLMAYQKNLSSSNYL